MDTVKPAGRVGNYFKNAFETHFKRNWTNNVWTEKKNLWKFLPEISEFWKKVFNMSFLWHIIMSYLGAYGTLVTWLHILFFEVPKISFKIAFLIFMPRGKNFQILQKFWFCQHCRNWKFRPKIEFSSKLLNFT